MNKSERSIKQFDFLWVCYLKVFINLWLPYLIENLTEEPTKVFPFSGTKLFIFLANKQVKNHSCFPSSIPDEANPIRHIVDDMDIVTSNNIDELILIRDLINCPETCLGHWVYVLNHCFLSLECAFPFIRF